jgi:endogenous inhibitor of DNA gyrase (YacG/DUF329 family)
MFGITPGKLPLSWCGSDKITRMSSEQGKVGETAAVCVFCHRHPVAATWRPFCSERCKLQDLARWADGAYRVAGSPLQEPDAEDPTTHT